MGKYKIMHDIAFYTHAVTKTGFGHVARCVNTVKLLKKKKIKIWI